MFLDGRRADDGFITRKIFEEFKALKSLERFESVIPVKAFAPCSDKVNP